MTTRPFARYSILSILLLATVVALAIAFTNQAWQNSQLRQIAVDLRENLHENAWPRRDRICARSTTVPVSELFAEDGVLATWQLFLPPDRNYVLSFPFITAIAPIGLQSGLSGITLKLTENASGGIRLDIHQNDSSIAQMDLKAQPDLLQPLMKNHFSLAGMFSTQTASFGTPMTLFDLGNLDSSSELERVHVRIEEFKPIQTVQQKYGKEDHP